MRVCALALVILETEGGLKQKDHHHYHYNHDHHHYNNYAGLVNIVNSGTYLVTFHYSPPGIIKYLEMRKGFHRVKVLQHRSKDLYRDVQHQLKMEFCNFRRKSHNCFPLKFVRLSVAVKKVYFS